MSITDTIKASLIGYTIKDESYGLSFKKAIAERKTFLSTKKLEYSVKVKIDEAQKTVTFTDMLKESGSGLSTGDNDMSSGFGFSATTYSSGLGGRSGTIEEQSVLFGKKYSFSFDYGETRKMLEGLCQKEGFSFNYSIF